MSQLAIALFIVFLFSLPLIGLFYCMFKMMETMDEQRQNRRDLIEAILKDGEEDD